MLHNDIYRTLNITPISQAGNARVQNEIIRMKEDMRILFTISSIDELRDIYLRNSSRCRTVRIQGDSMLEMARNAVLVAGPGFLTDALYLNNFSIAEQLRIAKINMLSQMVSRDAFFRSRARGEHVQSGRNQCREVVKDNAPFLHFLGLPVEMIGEIMQRTDYKDAQNLAATCRSINEIYRKSSAAMLLPDIALILDFTSGELKVCWLLDQEDQQDVNPDKVILKGKDHERRKNQLLLNCTFMKVETTDDFKAEDIGDVRKYIGNKKFKRVVVKGNVYTENFKKMVELFDKNIVEIEVNRLTEEDIPFPEIKTISIRENLNKEHGERLLPCTHFVNISCAFSEIDTFRTILQQWDAEEREIERWVILKPFTVFLTPFGRRHRESTCKTKGYLKYICEMSTDQMAHGEITEFLFEPAKR
uniref:F-box domain-containing protein n=1 Tax=Caenorhabditis japonica TaxID=281687 RepID=A0A8R1I477_CAEJA